MKELCEELFCHIFDAIDGDEKSHKHIFECEAPKSAILHLLTHFQKNDNNILTLLCCENNEIFLRYFKENLKKTLAKNPQIFTIEKISDVPHDYLVNHISSSFVETVKWWVDNGMKESPETIAEYFSIVV